MMLLLKNNMMLLLGVLLMVFVPHVNAQCADSFDFCSQVKDLCDKSYVREQCKYSCGNCGPTESPSTESPVYTTDTPMGECGKPDVFNTRVIGGIEATRGSWPWQILLKLYGRPMCGGSLISPQWVVTAAHCVYGRERSGSFSIRVGEHDWTKVEGSEKDYDVVKVFRNSYYNPRVLNNDIALLKLRTPVLFNKYVKPVCLPEANVPVGTECYITGWGKIRHPGRMFPKLQQAVLPVVSNEECYRKNRRVIPIGITSAICGGDGGTTTRSGCHGDSGGPYVCKVKGVWELHGAVSHGSPVCKSTETYTVFARITHFKQWIKNIMAHN